MSARSWALVAIAGILLILVVRGAAMRRADGASATPAAGDAATTLHDLPLRSTSAIHADLYLPKRSEKKAPLFVWIEGNDPTPASAAVVYGGEVGEFLQRTGVVTLSLAFRAGEGRSLRACAGDAARAIAEVERERGAFARVVLAGRGSGAWMAAMLALERSFFEAANFDPKRIDGVVGIRGTYDLTPGGLEGNPYSEFFARGAESLRESSPSAYVRADAPPFLLLSGGDDDGVFPRFARSFALALEKAGAHVERYVVPHHDAHNLTAWSAATGARNDLGALVRSFIDEGFHPLPPETTFGIRQRWSTHPPFDNADLRAEPKRIATYPVDDEFVRAVSFPLMAGRAELNTLPGKTYEAIDLLDWVTSRPSSEVGTGDWLVVTNRRGERLYFARRDLEAQKPVIVVGMDDEPNLSRIFTHYRLKQMYSWKPGEAPPSMIRPLGAFVHFRSPPPPHLRNKSFMPFTVTAKSFRWVKDDPLAPVRDVPERVRDALVGEQGCLKCHSFRGVGARSQHLRAADGEPAGAFALPFEEYPADVMRRFLFEQEAVAKSFDVAPLRVDPDVAQGLFALVVPNAK